MINLLKWFVPVRWVLNLGWRIRKVFVFAAIVLMGAIIYKNLGQNATVFYGIGAIWTYFMTRAL